MCVKEVNNVSLSIKRDIQCSPVNPFPAIIVYFVPYSFECVLQLQSIGDVSVDAVKISVKDKKCKSHKYRLTDSHCIMYCYGISTMVTLSLSL